MENNAARLADSLMKRYPKADRYPYKSWSYSQGFYLWGLIRLYESTRSEKYFRYVLEYGDFHVAEDGEIGAFTGESLDDIMPASVLAWLYHKTGQSKFRLACERVRSVFDRYPRTRDGGFWHALSRKGEMWADGLFMGLMFLVRYGAYIGDASCCYSEAIRQLNLIFEKCRKDRTGFIYHAHSESQDCGWASPLTGCSPEVWSEGLGWYAMALAETLGFIPEDFPKRETLVRQLQKLCEDLLKVQDWGKGLWYQVPDKPEAPRNFHDTSGSAMFLYALKKAHALSFIKDDYVGEVMEKAYRGILEKCVAGMDGGFHVLDACDGLCVLKNYDCYVDAPRAVDAKEAVAAVLWALAAFEEGIQIS